MDITGGSNGRRAGFNWAPEANRMDNTQLNWIANFIWGIADDVLRDVYVRGKYRDVILTYSSERGPDPTSTAGAA